MPRGLQLSVTMANKPGQLAKVGAALARAKVNIEAISVVDSAEVGVVRMLTSSAAKAKAALKKMGLEAVQQPVLVLKLANEPGALSEVAKKLAAAKINIEYVYGSAAGKGELSTIVLGVSDVAKAVKVKL
ncbi:MAG: ACT domain-containing protein [Armatimonadetes bacterium]|nr:ACT domain-containing protein [Armatimonadota bacterium]